MNILEKAVMAAFTEKIYKIILDESDNIIYKIEIAKGRNNLNIYIDARNLETDKFIHYSKDIILFPKNPKAKEKLEECYNELNEKIKELKTK